MKKGNGGESRSSRSTSIKDSKKLRFTSLEDFALDLTGLSECSRYKVNPVFAESERYDPIERKFDRLIFVRVDLDGIGGSQDCSGICE
jgi:hypothetical protein